MPKLSKPIISPEKLSEPMFNQSVGEFLDIQNEFLDKKFEHFQNLLIDNKNTKAEDDIVRKEYVMETCNYTKDSVYSKVSRKEIPTISRGKPLLFSKKQILKWVYAGKPTLKEMEDAELQGAVNDHLIKQGK